MTHRRGIEYAQTEIVKVINNKILQKAKHDKAIQYCFSVGHMTILKSAKQT